MVLKCLMLAPVTSPPEEREGSLIHTKRVIPFGVGFSFSFPLPTGMHPSRTMDSVPLAVLQQYHDSA